MSLIFNVRHLENKNLQLEGELEVAALELGINDELVQPISALRYRLLVQKLDSGILAQGEIALTLKCECARCLKPYIYELALKDWACHLSLEGEEALAVNNDLADLTPYVREDILLSFPQHPLCEPECRGLVSPGQDRQNAKKQGSESTSAAWAELNKLKF